MNAFHRFKTDKHPGSSGNEPEDQEHRILQLKIRIAILANILIALLFFLCWFCLRPVKGPHDAAEDGKISAREIECAQKHDSVIRTVLPANLGMLIDDANLYSAQRALWLLGTHLDGPDCAAVGHFRERLAMTSSDALLFTGRVARLEKSILEEPRSLPVAWPASMQANSSRAFLYSSSCDTDFIGRSPRRRQLFTSTSVERFPEVNFLSVEA
jgi:hypothetical protein